jgi:putative endonuclease
MEVTVYALRFETGEIYVGLTRDLARRLGEHRRRQSPSTRRFGGEPQLIHTEVVKGYEAARRVEKYLKSGAGRRYLKSNVDVEGSPRSTR